MPHRATVYSSFQTNHPSFSRRILSYLPYGLKQAKETYRFEFHSQFFGQKCNLSLISPHLDCIINTCSTERRGRCTEQQAYKRMNLTSHENIFSLLSVIELHLPAQNTVIQPRAYSTLSFRLQGNATMHHKDRQFDIGSDAIYFVPAGCSYHIKSDPEVVLCINLNISNQEYMQPEYFIPHNAPVFREAFQSIYNTWSMKKPGYFHKCMSLLYSILSQMEKQFSQAYHSPAFLSIKSAVNHMHAHFTDPDLTIFSLCEISNLSDTQFRRNFYEIYGTTPLKYLQTLRVNYAADLLAGSTLSVEEISSMCGFSDSKYFCSVFKKYKSYPPSGFRKML